MSAPLTDSRKRIPPPPNIFLTLPFVLFFSLSLSAYPRSSCRPCNYLRLFFGSGNFFGNSDAHVGRCRPDSSIYPRLLQISRHQLKSVSRLLLLMRSEGADYTLCPCYTRFFTPLAPLFFGRHALRQTRGLSCMFSGLCGRD